MLAVNGLYGHIRANAFKSALLLAGFSVLIAVYFYAFCLIFTAVSEYNAPRAAIYTPFTVDLILRHAEALALQKWWLAAAMTASWFAVAYLFHDNMIRMATGAEDVQRAEEPQLYNLVENLAIAAGLPKPRIEVMPTEALNAYASGLGSSSATIAVTRGLLRSLTRNELEAVLAHEMTHIVNHDVKLMAVVMVFTGGLTWLGDAVKSLFSRSDGDNSSGWWWGSSGGSRSSSVHSDDAKSFLPALIAIVIGVALLALTHVFALMSNFAISRSREFMADAGSVELTKNPDALISALMKISGNSEVPGVFASAQSMMFSGDFASLFATHPSIEDRVSALQRYAGGRAIAPAARGHVTGVAGPAPANAMGFAGNPRPFGRRRVAP
jgi:heat shock protein HtpX